MLVKLVIYLIFGKAKNAPADQRIVNLSAFNQLSFMVRSTSKDEHG